MDALRVTEPKYLHLEPGAYDAMVKGVKYDVGGSYGRSLKFTFQILNAGLEPGKDEIIAYASAKADGFTAGTKAFKWLTTVTGRNLELNDTIDPELAIGKRCQVILVDHTTQGGQVCSRVSEVLRSRQGTGPEREPGVDDDLSF